jgi:hypothetical protein
VKVLANIDIVNDGRLQGRFVRLSLVPLVVGAAVSVLLWAAGACEGITLGWLAASVCVFTVSLPVHEAVHAAAFKLLAPGCRVSFEVRDWFVATNAHGAVAPRRAELVVLLAPALVVTALLAAVPALLGFQLFGVVQSFIHLSGCAGDVAMALEIAHEPECTHVRDTDNGIDLLKEE